MIRIYHNLTPQWRMIFEVDTAAEAAQLLNTLNTPPTPPPVAAPPTDNNTLLLTPVQHETLQYLHKHGDTTAGDIAAHTGINRTAAAFRLRQLVTIGAAERVSRGIYRGRELL